MDKYEVQLAKYSALSKSKEPSSIREEAFRLHEARKEYVRMSGQHVLRILNFRSSLEHCLVERFSSVTLAHKDFYNDIQIWANLDAAVSFWRQWLTDDKVTCAYQLQKQQIARKRLEDEYIQRIAPDHELVKYTVPTSPTHSQATFINSKWGYLFVRVSRHTWYRKWFFLYSGYFGACQVDKQKNAVVCESRISVENGSIQPITDSDRRFCFEVSSQETSFTLQAETENDLQDWIRVFQANKTPTRSRPVSVVMDDTNSLLTRNLSDEGPSYVAISTTPETGITLSSSSSLTPLLVWEGIRNSSGSRTLPAGSWGIPWSFVPTMINFTQDANIVPPDTTTKGSAEFPRVVWPAKTIMAEVPTVDWEGYELATDNKELRALFGGVKPEEIVLDAFVCCLRKPGVDSTGIKEIETSQSTLNSPCADMYEKEFVHQLKQTDTTPPSNYGYAYTGRCYITQDTFWFYSCVMTTCTHSVVVRLKDIEDIQIIKDESLKHLTNDTALTMKSDMIITIRLKNQPLIVLGTLMDDIDVVAEKLTHAVKNAKNEQPAQQTYSELKKISAKSLSHKSFVLDLPITFGNAVTSSNKPVNTGMVHKGRPHAATVGAVSHELPKKRTPKPDPDMPPVPCPEGPVECNCTDHLDRQDLQIQLPISAKRCFDLLFSDEHNAIPPTNGGVWQDKTEAIEGHDLSVSPWTNNTRVLKYWMPVANPIVRMKEAEVVETQVLISKEEYVRYTVQISTKTAALPYAEAFIPSVRYCITWISMSECQLTCYLGVKWVKNPLVKSIVTRSALKGMSDSVSVFGPILKEAAEKIKVAVDEERQRVLEYNQGQEEKKVEPSPSVSATTVMEVPKPVKVVQPVIQQPVKEKVVEVPKVEVIQKEGVKHHHVEPKELKSDDRFAWIHGMKETLMENSIHVVIIMTIGVLMYFSLSWFSPGGVLSLEEEPIKVNNVTIPFRRVSSQSVYLKDLDEGLLQNAIPPPFSKSNRYVIYDTETDLFDLLEVVIGRF